MSSAMVGNGYPPNYNTYNSQPSPSHGQNLQEGYYDPHPSSRPPANEQQHYRSSPSQPHSVQKEKNASPRRAPTPPNGLDIVTQDERTRMAREKQRQYGQELQRDMIPDLHLESFRKDPMLDRRKEERNREYNKFLDEEHNREQQRREKLENLRKQPAVQPKYDNYSNSDNHERHRHNLESERRGEYQSFLSKLPQKTVRHIPSGGSRKEVDFENQKAFPMGNDYAEKQKKLREEWRKSYEIQMEKVGHSTKKKGEVPRRQGDPSVDEKNMFSDMGKAQEAHSRRMQENARQDYKNYVDHDSWYSAQPPTHRYSPPRDLGPEQNGQKSNDPYTERLQQARANEAMYRRHDHEMNGQSQRAPPPRQEAPYALH